MRYLISEKLAIGLFLVLETVLFDEGADKVESKVAYDIEYDFCINSDIKPYTKVDLEYSINTDSGDIKFKNGLYYGADVGINYNNFNFGL